MVPENDGRRHAAASPTLELDTVAGVHGVILNKLRTRLQLCAAYTTENNQWMSKFLQNISSYCRSRNETPVKVEINLVISACTEITGRCSLL